MNINKDAESEHTQPNEIKSEGVPDIGKAKKNSSLTFLVVAFIVIIGIYAISHFHQDQDNNQDENEENFNIQNTQQAPVINADTQQTTTTSQSNNVTPSDNNNDAQKALEQRIQAPMILVAQNQTSAPASPDADSKSNINGDANMQFMHDVSDEQTDSVTATLLQHRDTLIAQGNLIHAVLETAIDSDLPGYLRAIVSEPVYSEDGSQVLIQPGSRLIGQYKSGMLQGQSRVFVVWTRLIEPNGISIQLGSPGIDRLGMAGQQADQVDYHFWQTFGTASLLSVIGAGASNAGVNSSDQNNASQAYREALATSFSQSAQNSLQSNTAIPPTLDINQGAAIMVFVARDLRFGSL